MEPTAAANVSNSVEGVSANRIVSEPALQIMYFVIGTIGMIGNIFVVVVILNFKSMRKQLTNIYILNQSLVDATVAFFLIFTSAFQDPGNHSGGLADEAFCRLWLTKLPLWGCLVSSTYNLLALTLERYLAIVHPIWHKMKFTRAKAYVIITCAWLWGLVYNAAYMIPSARIQEDGSCTVYSVWPNSTTQRAVGGFLTIFIQYFIPLCLLIFFYTRMILVLRRKTNPNEVKKDNKPDSMARARRNIIKTLALVGASFIFCWTWNQIYFLMFNLGVSAASSFTSTFYHFTVVMVFCNCCFNPLIYAANYTQFQLGMKKLFSKCCPGVVKSCTEGRSAKVKDISEVTEETGATK